MKRSWKNDNKSHYTIEKNHKRKKTPAQQRPAARTNEDYHTTTPLSCHPNLQFTKQCDRHPLEYQSQCRK